MDTELIELTTAMQNKELIDALNSNFKKLEKSIAATSTKIDSLNSRIDDLETHIGEKIAEGLTAVDTNLKTEFSPRFNTLDQNIYKILKHLEIE